MRVAQALTLTGEQRTTLVRWSRGRSTPARLVLRAKITLRAAAGMLNKDIARELATDVNTVGRWRRRFAEGGLDAIAKDAPRGGRKPIKRSRLAARIIKKTTTEKPAGAIVQFGGQTAINLALPLEKEIARLGLKTRILGTSPDSIDLAEDRERFNALMTRLNIHQPNAGIAFSPAEAREVAAKIGYPVLVRPSYVLGGRAMEIVYDEKGLDVYMQEAVRVSREHPVLIDDFLQDAVEIDVDAVCDGKDVLIGAIMEHIEEAGIHSGDSACMIPPQTLPGVVLEVVRDYVRKIALGLGVIGIVNLQMAYKDGTVYVLEANPRSSRTIPFVSKATGLPLAKIAANVMIGKSLAEQGYTREPKVPYVAVKEVLLPFDKLPGADALLGPEMRSTGEVMGIDYQLGLAFFKAELSAYNPCPGGGVVSLCVKDEDQGGSGCGGEEARRCRPGYHRHGQYRRVSLKIGNKGGEGAEDL